MAPRLVTTLAVAAAVWLAVRPAVAAEYADGWTTTEVDHAVEGCTEALVQGAWANTKKDEGFDPEMPLSDEIRTQLKPQIEGFRGFCGCVVKEMARTVSRKAYASDEGDMSHRVDGIVKSGKCKAPK